MTSARLPLTGPSVSFVLGLAAFFAVFGLLIWFVSRRKGDRDTSRLLLVGLPGVYFCGVAAVGAWKWLYVPGVALVVSAYVLQLVLWRQQASKSRNSGDAAPDGSDGSSRP